MRENILKAKSTDKESIFGNLESTMKDSGKWVKSKGMEFGRGSMETLILESGRGISRMGSENMFGLIKMFMKVFGRLV